MFTNTGGYDNNAIGYFALRYNTTGFQNVSVGNYAMEDNTDGFYNVAVGHAALSNLTTGEGNVAIGASAYTNTGDFDVCTSIGHLAAGGYFNSVSLGYATALTDEDQVRIGNSFTTSIGGFANWTNVSDKRFKKDIESNVPGLEFINKLNPVTYTYDHVAIKQFHMLHNMVYPDQNKFSFDTEGTTMSGFLAQDVKAAAESLNYDFSGVDQPQNENGYYGLRYSEFVVPLVKAAQELDAKVTTQEDLILQLIQQNEALINRIEALEDELGKK